MDSQTQKPKVVIYSDGGAKPNPNGPGGWAVLLISGDNRRELSGGERSTTNNRMELTAACEALEALKTACEVEFHTDSQYVKNGITTWMKNWIKNGWKTASKQPVANQDLWERLDAATKRHSIQWKWVRGHAGHEHNERVDHLATAARERIQRGG